MPSPKAPTPGSTTRSALAQVFGSGRDDDLRAHVPEGVGHAVQVAEAVVDHVDPSGAHSRTS